MQTFEKSKPISVYDFQNYRSFLIAHFESVKDRNPAWSYQAWAKKLLLKNNTSLLKVIKGSRDAGPQIMSKLEGYFRFAPTEQQYFRALVALAKAEKHPEMKSAILEQLVRIHPKREIEQLSEYQFTAI